MVLTRLKVINVMDMGWCILITLPMLLTNYTYFSLWLFTAIVYGFNLAAIQPLVKTNQPMTLITIEPLFL